MAAFPTRVLSSGQRTLRVNFLRRFFARTALGPGDRERFEREGFLVIDPKIPGRVLGGVVAELDGKYTSPAPLQVSYRDAGRVQDAWRVSANVRHVARAKRVRAVLRELYGREPLPFQTLNFPTGTEQRIHSDTIHFNSSPSGFLCGVWVALEDIDRDNGPLVFYPGSHRLPEYTMADFGGPAGPAHYVRYEDFLERVIAEHGLRPEYATLRKGQALVWAGNLLHGGAPHRDRGRSRHSQVTHYFFPGCRYYTPLFSDRGQVCWRQPEWIQPRRPVWKAVRVAGSLARRFGADRRLRRHR